MSPLLYARNTLLFNLSLFLLAKLEFAIGAGIYSEVKHVRLGDDVKLICPFKNLFRIEWFKDMQPFDNTADIEIRNVSLAQQGRPEIHKI